jgi:UTP:GlnB (protein PII) uridylyltransferase
MLTLEAVDSLGLLGSLLSAFAQLGLFPDELHIETRDGRAYDCIWLSAAGGVPPTALARDRAAQLLRRSCPTGPLSSR